MMLQGANILVPITNWPLLGQIVADRIAPPGPWRTLSTYVVADRVGVERGGEFIGQSKIINAAGQTKAIGRRPSSMAFALPAGAYEITGYDRTCNGNCRNLGAPINQCKVPFTLKPGETLFVERIMAGRSCTLAISSKAP
jgi:hypothetical protein